MSDQGKLMAEIADRIAIQDLIVKYARARDTTDASLYREIFAADATIGSPGKAFSSNLEEILAKVASDVIRFNPGSRPGTTTYAIMRHEVTNALVTINGDTARSDYYVDTLAYNEAARRPEIIATARNEDEYRRDDGRWLITRSTLNFGWNHEEMGKALQVGPYTPPQYRH